MLNRYFIIDDFYRDPDRLVETALNSPKENSSRGKYAGVMTLDSFFSNEQRLFFENLLDEKLIDSATQLNGRIRFSTPSDYYKQNIHFDGGKTRWSGVVYLSKNHPEVEGTNFWKNRKTGLEEIPRTEEDSIKYRLNTKEKIKNLLEVEGVDNSYWKKTFSVPYKYNRLVLFRPWLFHSPGQAFGDSIKSSRIVQTLFFAP